MADEKHSNSPVHIPWETRKRGVLAMPGGYDGYLQSLRWTAETTQEAPPSQMELAHRLARRFDLTDGSARYRLSFLKKVGYLRVDSGVWVLPEFIKSWLLDRDPIPLLVRLHIEMRFIGEMLKALDRPMTTAELRERACAQFLMGWKDNSQIDNRRGWLQSAGLMECTHEKRLYRTDAGTAFLDLVVVEPPLDRDALEPRRAVEDRPRSKPLPRRDETVRSCGSSYAAARRVPAADLAPAGSRAEHYVGQVKDLADRIVAASTDTRKPEQFESVVCEAFSFLGFDAEHLGGPGRTDVLLEARFGANAGYRVVVDAKTTSQAALPTQQVVFDTLAEHREKHKAEFAMVVGPNPSVRKLVDRASRHAVPMMSAKTLADLCIMHATQPLGLDDYRSMFEQGGAADTSRIRRRAEEVQRLTSLAKRLVMALAEKAQALGPMTAAGLRISMYDRQSEADLPTEEEIGAVLSSLASTLVGAIQGDPDNGYVLACSPTVTAERLRILGEALSTS